MVTAQLLFRCNGGSGGKGDSRMAGASNSPLAGGAGKLGDLLRTPSAASSRAVELTDRRRVRGIRTRFYDEFWQASARQLSADTCQHSHGLTEIRWGTKSTFVRAAEMMADNPIALDIAGDKELALSLLQRCGAPTPAHVGFGPTNLDPALTLLQRAGRVVVKPASGSGGGRGVTTGITDEVSLRQAVSTAASFSRRLLAEAHVEGASYRVLVVGGEIIDVVRRDPPTVVGTGSDSIRRLVAQENRRRLTDGDRALSLLRLDQDATQALADTGCTPWTVPGAGETLRVKRAVNQNHCEDNVTVTSELSEEIRAACCRLAEQLGVAVAGIDLLCSDIAGRFAPTNLVVGELNTTPGLHHHVLVKGGRPKEEIGVPLLEFLFRTKGSHISGGEEQ